MLNPASVMKIMNAKAQFDHNHPKFSAFMKAFFSKEIKQGTIIEITVKRPGEDEMTSNIKIQQTDLELMGELKELIKGGV